MIIKSYKLNLVSTSLAITAAIKTLKAMLYIIEMITCALRQKKEAPGVKQGPCPMRKKAGQMQNFLPHAAGGHDHFAMIGRAYHNGVVGQ